MNETNLIITAIQLIMMTKITIITKIARILRSPLDIHTHDDNWSRARRVGPLHDAVVVEGGPFS